MIQEYKSRQGHPVYDKLNAQVMNARIRTFG